MTDQLKPCPLCDGPAHGYSTVGKNYAMCINRHCELYDARITFIAWQSLLPPPSEDAEALPAVLSEDELQTLRHAANGLVDWGDIRYITVIEELHDIIARLK